MVAYYIFDICTTQLQSDDNFVMANFSKCVSIFWNFYQQIFAMRVSMTAVSICVASKGEVLKLEAVLQGKVFLLRGMPVGPSPSSQLPSNQAWQLLRGLPQ